ncbi:MAG: transposase, partial [Clostridia bacterium]|nr:transposase [Clostridia bacterium]
DMPWKSNLLPWGKIVDKYITQMSDFYEDMKVEQYVIMPNHIHFLFSVKKDGASRTSPPTREGEVSRQHAAASRFVSTLKRFCNKEIGQSIWQRHFYDHIIRTQEDYEEHLRYIQSNPARWHYDELYAE